MQLIPINNLEAMRAAGLPFTTLGAARWDYRKSEERGTRRAYILLGNKVHIDPEIWHQAIREAQAA